MSVIEATPEDVVEDVTDDEIVDDTDDTAPTVVGPLDNAKFVGGRLTINDDHELKRLKRRNMSPSSASTLDSCPARYAASRMIHEEPSPMSAMELGTSAHAVLETFYGLPHDKRTPEAIDTIIEAMLGDADGEYMLPDEMDDLIDDPQDPAALAAMEEWREAVRTRSVGIFDIEDPSKVKVRRTEWKLSGVEVAGVPFNGIADRADVVTERDGSSTTSVVDYKTGKAMFASPHWNDDQGDQMRLYVMAIEAFDGTKPGHARLFYTAHGKDRFVSLTNKEMDGTKRRFVGAWESIQEATEKDSFECRTSGLCGWCPLVDTCPAAAEAGKTRSDRYEGPSLSVPVEPARKVVTMADLPFDVDDYEEPGKPDDTTLNVIEGGEAVNDTPTKENRMNGQLREDKPWEETAGPDNNLNPSSYAATAVFGTTALAVELLDNAGLALTRPSVDAMAKTLAKLAADVQMRLTGSTSMQEGANTRIRGVIHTVVETMPPPLSGATSSEWRKWVDDARKRANAIALAAVRLHGTTLVDEPWAPLAVESEAEAEAAANDFAS